MDETRVAAAPVRLDEVDTGDGPGGVVWSADPSQLKVNLVVLPPGEMIAGHTNAEVDVLLVVVAGGGQVTAGGIEHELVPPGAMVIPLGLERSIVAGPDGIRYLSVHRARGSLTIRPGSAPRPPG